MDERVWLDLAESRYLRGKSISPLRALRSLTSMRDVDRRSYERGSEGMSFIYHYDLGSMPTCYSLRRSNTYSKSPATITLRRRPRIS